MKSETNGKNDPQNEQKKYYEPIRPHPNGGILAKEIIRTTDGQVTEGTVLIVPAGTRPGVWCNGNERPRQQVIYGVHAEPGLHPRDDARNHYSTR